MYNACALCGSSDLIRNVRVHDDGTGWGYSAREHYVTIERKPQAVLFNDATITPKGAPVTDVSAIAKFDLKAGDTLDGVGGFKAYGVMENSPVARAEDLLPMGLTDGCVLKRDLAQDTPITFADVELPADRLSDQLWREQLAAF